MININQDRVMRHVIVYQDEEGYWIVECPSLPGCATQGDTRAEALENIKEAIAGYIEVLRDHGDPIPEDKVEFLTVHAA